MTDMSGNGAGGASMSGSVAAMMRRGNKLASFRLLASALSRIQHLRWRLGIVGDGEAMQDVRAAFASFDAERIRFEGAVAHDAMASLLQSADLFVWPAVDEVIGMGLLEAQACGLPVIAGAGYRQDSLACRPGTPFR